MTDQTTPSPKSRTALKDNPSTADLEKATSPVEYLIEKLL